jgi:regulator of protease activity HflC (stomatin/prohibitin superfamily)
LAALLALAAIVFGVVPGIAALFSFSRTDGGHVAIVRNGGPLDDNTIRQYLPISSGLEYTGLWSSVHQYPAQARFYDLVPGGADAPGVNAFRTPTRDGVDVGLTARINFTLNTDEATLRKFDDAYGTREFKVTGSSSTLAPWEGDEGFATFLDVIAKPVIEETVRQQVGNVDCAALQSSCALVQNGGNANVAADTTPNSQVLQSIQKAVNDALAQNVNARLGGAYLSNIQVSITGVDLPQQIRDKILAAQAGFADASAAQARLNSARTDADANAERQRGYNACPTCGEIDKIRAQGDALAKIPPGVQVYAPGGGAQITAGR